MKKPENIPNNPGCYLYKNKNKKIIYIGKAKNLKKRVNSYFDNKEHDIKTNILLNNIDSVDFIITDNEYEALILENSLIKQHNPKYNIQLKDAKSYAYLELTKEEYPRLLLSRTKNKKNQTFGPFVSAKERDYLLKLLTKTFELRTCKKIPKKPCLRHHIKLCSSPCINQITKNEYNNRIKKIKLVLKGKTKELIQKLEKEMKKYAKNKDFEKAIILRNQLNALNHLNEHQKMERKKNYNEDIINYEIINDKVYLLLFNIYKGTLSQKHEFIFNKTPDFLEEFILRYYSENKKVKEVIIPIKVSDSIKKYFKIKFVVPKKGIKKELLELTKKNIELTFFKEDKKLQKLQKILRLNNIPKIIECFDVSHLGGTLTVGSMVRFSNGKPDKTNYRRFKIRGNYGIDDVKSIAELVKRRYTRLKEEEKQMPDLIIVDGGKSQLNESMKELEKLNLKIPIIGLAKKYEEIIVPGLSVGIRYKKDNIALLLLMQIRDEAHRFAIKYNKILRKKRIK